jgi:KEOPS complex subunit Pcc1
MPNSAEASICLNFNSEKMLAILLDALRPEAKSPPTHRSVVKLKTDGTCLTLVINAEDTVALRATINAYLHWIQASLNVIDKLTKLVVALNSPL